MERHFTVTGFLVHEGRTLLIWHAKNQMWLPPGGHIEEGEEPEEAVLREIAEEAGVAARVVPTHAPRPFAEPRQVPRPEAILLEDIREPGRPHQHIDLIYFCAPLSGAAFGEPDGVARWLGPDALGGETPLEYAPGLAAVVPLDVRVLALEAIAHVSRTIETQGT